MCVCGVLLLFFNAYHPHTQHSPHTHITSPHTHHHPTPHTGLALLGHIEEKFIEVVDTYEPTTDGSVDKCYISKSYDATSHFESTMDDVLDMYYRITGKKFDLSKKI